jgi:peptidoglycan/xylan/chitin deacetylase (PgdA/CDA1 family)
LTCDLTLHALGGPSGSHLADALNAGADARFQPVIGPFPHPVARVSGPGGLLAELRHGLPEGPAVPEAVALRARRRGHTLHWGEPDRVADVAAALRCCRAWGRSAVEVWRSDPSLLTETAAGGWYNAGWRWRMLRRIALRSPARWSPEGEPRLLRLELDAAFWGGVRDGATRNEWQRLTGASYVALVYHRVAGAGVPDQSRVDIAPARFSRQMRALHALGFRELSVPELLAFHSTGGRPLPRRRFVVTIDDGFADNLAPLFRHATRGGTGRTHLYVPTDDVGGRAYWLAGEPVLGWNDLRLLAEAGIVVGSHAHRHVRLTTLARCERREGLRESREALHRRLGARADLLAYPNGDHDADVREDARAAGFRAAFTTAKGRNGVGTDPYCLRRVSVHAEDGIAAVIWKVATGEALPSWWQRARSGLREALGG